MNEISVTVDVNDRDGKEWLAIDVRANTQSVTLTALGFLGSKGQPHTIPTDFPWTSGPPGTMRPGGVQWPYRLDSQYPRLPLCTPILTFADHIRKRLALEVPDRLSLFAQDTNGKRHYARDISQKTGQKDQCRYVEFSTYDELKELIVLHAMEARKRGDRIVHLKYYGSQQYNPGPIDCLVLHFDRPGPSGSDSPDISFLHADRSKLQSPAQRLLAQFPVRDNMPIDAEIDYDQIIEEHEKAQQVSSEPVQSVSVQMSVGDGAMIAMGHDIEQSNADIDGDRNTAAAGKNNQQGSGDRSGWKLLGRLAIILTIITGVAAIVGWILGVFGAAP